MTEAEAWLCEELRGRRLDRIKFRRQVPVGPYVADFLCTEAMLVVEIDGTQHADSHRDRIRDAELSRRGFRELSDLCGIDVDWRHGRQMALLQIREKRRSLRIAFVLLFT